MKLTRRERRLVRKADDKFRPWKQDSTWFVTVKQPGVIRPTFELRAKQALPNVPVLSETGQRRLTDSLYAIRQTELESE